MLIDDAIKQYLLWKSSHTTQAPKRYHTRLQHFKAFVGYEINLRDIKGNDIINYHNHMAKVGYSLNTISYSTRILKNFFEFWNGRGESNLNPKEIIPVRFIPREKYPVIQEDINNMSDILNEGYFDELTKKLVIHLLWDTGMRVSELCDMTLEDIDTVKKTAKIRSRKSFKYNTIAWGSKTHDLMCRYLGVRLCKYPNTDYLLVSTKDKTSKVSTRTIQRWIKCLSVLIGKEVTPHSFRHGKAHSMLNKGANMRDVQVILRHVNPISSFHYVGVNAQQVLSIADKYLN